MILRFPRASGLSHLPFILFSIRDTYFWLVVVWKIVDQQPPKAKALPKSLFVLSFHLVTPNDGMTPPTRSNFRRHVGDIASQALDGSTLCWIERMPSKPIGGGNGFTMVVVFIGCEVWLA